MGVVILDGRAVAAERIPLLRARSLAVAERRGHPPRVLILAFADANGTAPWLRGKRTAAAAAGVEVETLIVSAEADTGATVAAFRAAIERAGADGVFVQFPYPAGVDGDAVAAEIPPAADVDVMHPEQVRAYLSGPEPGAPPITITAILELLDAHDVALAGRRCAVLAPAPTDFERMLVAAASRRGADARIEDPAADDLGARLLDTAVVITSIGRPGAVPGAALPAGAVVVDGGYFNPGARGDVANGDGLGHLQALAPVPGGIGPLTVVALLDAVVARAESV